MKTVLLVQSPHQCLQETEQAVRSAGYHVLTCGGPAERQSPCWAYGPRGCQLWRRADLVIYDVRSAGLPFGHRHLGLERQRHPGVPVLILSAAVSPEMLVDEVNARLGGSHGAGRPASVAG